MYIVIVLWFTVPLDRLVGTLAVMGIVGRWDMGIVGRWDAGAVWEFPMNLSSQPRKVCFWFYSCVCVYVVLKVGTLHRYMIAHG